LERYSTAPRAARPPRSTIANSVHDEVGFIALVECGVELYPVAVFAAGHRFLPRRPTWLAMSAFAALKSCPWKYSVPVCTAPPAVIAPELIQVLDASGRASVMD